MDIFKLFEGLRINLRKNMLNFEQKHLNFGQDGRCRQVSMTFGTYLGCRWSEVDLVLKFFGRDWGWLLLTGGR